MTNDRPEYPYPSGVRVQSCMCRPCVCTYFKHRIGAWKKEVQSKKARSFLRHSSWFLEQFQPGFGWNLNPIFGSVRRQFWKKLTKQMGKNDPPNRRTSLAVPDEEWYPFAQPLPAMPAETVCVANQEKRSFSQWLTITPSGVLESHVSQGALCSFPLPPR